MFITLKKKLVEIITVLLKSIDFELVGVELIRSRQLTLRVYIDKKSKGVTADDCAYVSRQISVLLNVQEPILIAYNLEVSSPGLYRPLFSADNFVQFIGSEVNIVLRIIMHGRRKWQGIIKSVDGEFITVIVNNHDEVFALHNIQKANLIPNFNIELRQ